MELEFAIRQTHVHELNKNAMKLELASYHESTSDNTLKLYPKYGKKSVNHLCHINLTRYFVTSFYRIFIYDAIIMNKGVL